MKVRLKHSLFIDGIAYTNGKDGKADIPEKHLKKIAGLGLAAHATKKAATKKTVTSKDSDAEETPTTQTQKSSS